MRSGARLLCAAMAVATAATSGCSGPNKPSSARVTVTPAMGLHDGQQVRISVSGFPNLGEKVFLSECASAVAVNNEGCGEQLAGQVFFLTDGHGVGKASFVVHDHAASGPLDSPELPCSTACVLVATIGGSGSRSIAWAPLGFTGPVAPAGPGLRGYRIEQFACSPVANRGAQVILPATGVSALLVCPLPHQSEQPVVLTSASKAFTSLLNALAAPDSPRSRGPCPALLIATPPIIARSASVIALIKLPVDECNLPQAAVLAAIIQARSA